MRRARQLRAPVGPIARRPCPRRLTGLRIRQRPLACDQARPPRQVAAVDQTGDRDVHEVAVGHVHAAIRESEPARLDEEVQGVGAVAHGGQVEALQYAEYLRNGQAAG